MAKVNKVLREFESLGYKVIKSSYYITMCKANNTYININLVDMQFAKYFEHNGIETVVIPFSAREIQLLNKFIDCYKEETTNEK